MHLASPSTQGEEGLTAPVAACALQDFYALVAARGAVECDFVVKGEGGVTARFWVRFWDAGFG